MDAQLKHDYLEGMSRAATFVAVATTDGLRGRFGVTVSSMTSVSTEGDYPSLLICVHYLSLAAPAMLANRGFCLNLLNEEQSGVANLFAGREGDHPSARFDAVDWVPGPNGHPMIDGAVANFECQMATELWWKTHHVIVGEVTSVRLSEDSRPLLYGGRSYHRAVKLED
ncbi:flavin reductase family protein [Phaeobacter marinintestinus]|uniref:flavin reductase family protein n=1 Tax=Falsiphaeobacter marinintestinus TaxID=1492905 RepID=UPI0011B412AC|nr:flavin reductase family protein [Phaeobacter marinintestinus]